MRSRLLDTLYNAFDRDPHAVTAFSLWHTDGVVWQVTDRAMVVHSGAGALLADLAITGTVADMIAGLTGNGVTVGDVHSGVTGFHASVLVECSGSATYNIKGFIQAHQSILWALISSYAQSVTVASDSVPDAIRQATLHTAEGDWLDYWGGFFGIQRRSGQADDSYLSLIIAETLRPRNNKFAIENTVKNSTGLDITIVEPWQRIFTLDGSLLSGDDRMRDGVNFGRCLIRAESNSSVDWSMVAPIIDRNRAAGVIQITPQVYVKAGLSFNLAPVVGSALSRILANVTRYAFMARLDFDALEDIAIRNRSVLWRRTNMWWSHANFGGLGVVPVFSSHTRNYRQYGAFVLYPSNKWINASWRAGGETWGSFKFGVSCGHSRSP